MVLTTLALVDTAYLPLQSSMPNERVGALTTASVLLLPRLSFPWRAAASTSMVRSHLSVRTATIGAVRLMAPNRTTLTSTGALPV